MTILMMLQAVNHRVKLVPATPDSYNKLAEPSCRENVHLFPGKRNLYVNLDVDCSASPKHLTEAVLLIKISSMLADGYSGALMFLKTMRHQHGKHK